MGLLEKVGLQPTRQMLAARQVVDAKDYIHAQAELARTMKEALAYAGALKDVAAKAQLAKALQAADGSRRAAAATEDVAKRFALLRATTAQIEAAKEAAEKKSDGAARDEALALRGKIEASHRQAHDAWKRLAEAQEAAAKKVTGAVGAEKARLEAQKKQLDKQTAEAQHTLAQAEADAEALENPATSREEFVAILARQKSNAKVAGHTEVDAHGQVLDKKPGEKHVTTTTTSVEDGRAYTDKRETTRTVGLGGVTQTESKENEVSDGRSTLRTGEETKTTVSAAGISREKSRKTEVEHSDGKKVSVEESSATEIGKEGVSRTRKTTLTRSDGSASSTAATGGIERGDGKLGVAGGVTKTETDAAGTATAKGGKASVGALAGKDGYGAQAGGTGSVTQTRASGVTSGVVGGLNANIVCNIGDPAGDPPLYPLTLKVKLSASLAVSAGHAKQDGPAKAGIEAKAAKDATMECSYHLDAAELADYVKALTAASSGGTAAATKQEFAIIRAGVKQGWHVAYDMYKKGGGKLSAATIGQREGDSALVAGSTTLGGKASLGVKAISLEAGVEQSADFSTQATRNKEGGLDVETHSGASSKRSGKVGVSMGAVEGSVGGSHTVTSSLGYQITIDPKKDPKGELLAALAACRSDADYETFVTTHAKSIVVKGRTRARSVSETEEVGIGIGPAKGKIGLHSGVAEEVTTDGSGKRKGSKVTGTAGGGGGVEIAGIGWGDSADDEATSERDSDGNATLDLSRKRAETSFDKLVRAKVPGMGDKSAKKKGLLTRAAGGGEEEDTQVHDVAGIRLTNKDLDKIGKAVCASWRSWERAVTRYQDIPDWTAAGKKIVASGGERGVVADELARFIGGDKINRLDMVNRFIRPDGNVSTGTRYEFPESLKALKPDYDRLVIGSAEQAIEEVAKKEGVQKAGEFGKASFDALEKLAQAITGAKDFARPAVRAEMLSAVNARKTAVLAAMRRNAGKQSEQDEKAATEAEYHRILKTCVQYEATQSDVFENFKDWWAPGRTYNNDKLIRGVQQLRDLYAVWTPDFQRAAALGKQIGKPEAAYQRYGPRLDLFADWEKKIHQY